MIDLMVQTRMVVVLGRGRINADPVASVVRAADRNASLLVLCIGDPATNLQRAFIEEAIDRAFDAGVHLDAVWVRRVDGLAAYLEQGDDVTVATSGRDERRIDRALSQISA